ncbi:NAD binding domain of 6-phosphogluconate dehydrogenase-domain-containing protein [Phascolomyces articulosus]|uniref:NAD binding domain of 6-phosphogluconate dehydrogenase-domain-containing protein n=1 Tax=Phascolomyces articulosus TaxID=60185 RepID=A0AAD5PAV4_9FUNG|nr:NAD binding domain of 6-phosphogluconate dehydrogenase-domain-containing protein [Phascolomyces articulosus]
MNTDTPQVAYVGLGAIGFEISQKIHQHLISTGGKPLLVHNRTLARAEALKERVPDIQIADTLAKVAEQADIIITCLLNDAAVIQVVDTLLSHGLKPGTILVEQSTIAPEVSQQLGDKIMQHGDNLQFVACPIMGPPAKARAAALIILAGGKPDVLENNVLPLLVPATGPKVIRVGDEPKLALRMKLTGNFFITSFVELLAEGTTLAEASGIGQEHVKELMDGLFPGSVLPAYADRMVRNTFVDEIHFPLTSARKDATHIMNMAKESNASIPMTQVFLDHLNSVVEEHGDYDISGIVVQLRKEAGLKPDQGGRP